MIFRLVIGIYILMYYPATWADAVDDAFAAQKTKRSVKVSVDAGVHSALSQSQEKTYARANEIEDARAEKMRQIGERISEGKQCREDCYEVIRSQTEKTYIKCLVGASGDVARQETIWHRKGSTKYLPGSFDTFDEAARFACGY